MWYVQAKATAPRTLSARVVPDPGAAGESALGRGLPEGERPLRSVHSHLGAGGKSGEASIEAAATMELTLPYAKPPTCVATVYATLKSRRP